MGKFGLTLEDIVALTCLPMLDAIKIVLDEPDEKKLEASNMSRRRKIRALTPRG